MSNTVANNGVTFFGCSFRISQCINTDIFLLYMSSEFPACVYLLLDPRLVWAGGFPQPDMTQST
jgi:hypothetical protein